jgi:hypothetical protein
MKRSFGQPPLHAKWFPFDPSLAPSGSQATFSVRACGDVVMEFGRMRRAPFETPERSKPLRRALNRIDGIRIPARKIPGRPASPLAALEDPNRLLGFVAVVDRIVTEFRPLPPVTPDDAIITLAGAEPSAHATAVGAVAGG